MSRLACIVIPLAGLLASQAWADADVRAMAVNCRNCHTLTSAESEREIPALERQNKAQIRQALLDYKYDRKAATVMPRLAKGYSDAELAALANYFGVD